MQALEQISLYSNALSSLPASFEGLRSLKKLNLAANHFEAVPASLARLPALEWVALFDNPLTQPPIALPASAVAWERPFGPALPSATA